MLAQGEFKKLLLADSVEREGIFRKYLILTTLKKYKQSLKIKQQTLVKIELKVNMKWKLI